MAATKKPGRALLWSGIILLFIGIAPLASAFLASWIAEAHGCQLNEGVSHSCLIGGHDWGGALYTMFVLGWLMLLTIWLIPAGLVLAIIGLIQRRRGRTVPTPDPTNT